MLSRLFGKGVTLLYNNTKMSGIGIVDQKPYLILPDYEYPPNDDSS
jgi:hypothetical protein